MVKKAYQLHIEGRVQGVFFRASARDKAEKLGLTGVAKNELDGSITIEVEGEPKELREFIKWCREGSRDAEISRLDSKEVPVQHFVNFSVL